MDKKKLLFVCLGNICRSPAADEVMRVFVEKEGLSEFIEIDSAGLISFHKGEMPDSRMIEHAAKRGYKLTHISRPVEENDFYDFDMIFGMDDQNIKGLLQKSPDTSLNGKIHRLTDFCTKHDVREIPDPYYGGPKGFDYVLDLLEDACSNLLNVLKAEL